MNSAFVKAISYYIPDGSLNNDDLNALFPTWSADKISSKTGIFQRGIAEPRVSSGDLAYEAAQKLFNAHHILPSDIDFVLLCTQSPDYFLPTTACLLQDRLGIPTSAGALDFNLGCSGYVYGLSLAKGLICAGIAKNILLLTSETYSKYLNEQDKGNRSLFGDAAAATLISTDGLAKIGDFELGTDGSGAANLIVKNGAFRNRLLAGTDELDEAGNFVKNDNNLYMNGPEIFSFTAKSVPIMVENILQKSNLSMDDVDLFVFHQANEYMLNFIRKKIGIPQEKFYLFLRNCGNTVSSTIPIALSEALKSDINPGNKVLLAGFGVGYSWGSTILYF
jgi:3-oxoacyl-[acyl-carrier-protein] synthase-3